MSSLTWKRRGPGLGIVAEGAEHRYYVYRMTQGANSWTLKVVRLVDGPAGLRLSAPGNAGVQYDEHNHSQALTKAIAEFYETEPQHHANTQNRMTRAIRKAYAS
jgi:hypothetical protein